MRELGFEAWKWIAAGVLMGILTIMMVLGLGARRGTPLYRFRLTLWMLVLGLGGAGSAGCDSQGITGQPDAPDPDMSTCYVASDAGQEPDAPDPDMSTCYIPAEPPPEPMPEPVPDASTDPSMDERDDDDLDAVEDVPDVTTDEEDERDDS